MTARKADLVVNGDGALAEVIPIRRRCPVCRERVRVGPPAAPFVAPHTAVGQALACSGSLEYPVAR